MTCPECGEKAIARDTMKDCDAIYRKRVCIKCGYKFFTEEFETPAARENYNFMLSKKSKVRYRKIIGNTETIKVLVKRPGGPPRVKNILNRLKNMQRIVEGNIEAVTLAEDMVIICDEEGRLKNLPYNCDICGTSFVGTIIIAGRKEDDFSSFPTDYDTMKKLFPDLWKTDSDFADLEKAGGKFE